MVKKLQKMAEAKKAGTGSLLDNQLAGMVRDSAQQIWLAGMGAFAKAQDEGGKVFEALVREGTNLQKKTQSVAEERINEMTSKMTAVAEGVSSKAGAQWDKLESIFEQRVAKAMSKLGVPTNRDIDALVERIDALAAQVAKVAKAPARAGAKPAAKAAAKTARPAAKKAAPRRAAKKAAAADGASA